MIPVNKLTQAYLPGQAGPDAVQGQTVGAGVAGAGGGSAPDAANPGGVQGTVSPALASLSGMMGSGGAMDPTIAIIEVAAKMRDKNEKLGEKKIEGDEKQQEAAVKAKEAKYKKAEEDLQKIQHASIWDKIKMAFQALFSAIAIAVGTLMQAIPGAGVLGALMIAGGVIGLISVADDITKQVTGHGIMGNIYLACHPGDQNGAAKADMAFGICCAAAAIACSIASLVNAAGAAQAIAKAADAADQVAQVLKTIQMATRIAGAVSTIVTATGDTVAGAIEYDAASKQAAAKREQAAAKEFEAQITQIDNVIDHEIKTLASLSDQWSQMIGTASDTEKKTSKDLARIASRFAA
jgi:transloator